MTPFPPNTPKRHWCSDDCKTCHSKPPPEPHHKLVPTESWRERFDELWDSLFATGGDHRFPVQLEIIKKRIEDELASQRELLRKEVEERLNFIEEPVKRREQMGDPLNQIEKLKTPEYMGRVDELKNILAILKALDEHPHLLNPKAEGIKN